MATVEALKHKGHLKFNVVAVDVQGSKPSSARAGAGMGQAMGSTTAMPGAGVQGAARPGELILVAGSEDKHRPAGGKGPSATIIADRVSPT
jgi:hypothetical protein